MGVVCKRGDAEVKANLVAIIRGRVGVKKKSYNNGGCGASDRGFDGFQVG